MLGIKSSHRDQRNKHNVEQNEKKWPLENNKPLCKENNRSKIKIFWISKMWNKKTSQVKTVNVDLMHIIPVMKMKCLQRHQQYLNVSIPPSLLLKRIKPSPSPEQSKLDFSRTLHPTPLNNNSFSFGID